jgi:hypothetical protein
MSTDPTVYNISKKVPTGKYDPDAFMGMMCFFLQGCEYRQTGTMKCPETGKKVQVERFGISSAYGKPGEWTPIKK